MSYNFPKVKSYEKVIEASTAAQISNAFSSEDFDGAAILIKAGRYAFDDHLTTRGSRSIIAQGLVEFEFAQGKQWRTYTADNADRYYADDWGKVYWSGTKFAKANGAAFPTVDSSWRLALLNNGYTVSDSGSDASNIAVQETPSAPAGFDSSGEAKYCALFQPTSNLYFYGCFKVLGAAGHAGPVLNFIGLSDSDMSGARFEVSLPPGSIANASFFKCCCNSTIKLALKHLSTSRHDCNWHKSVNCFGCFEDFEAENLKMAASSGDGVHIAFAHFTSGHLITRLLGSVIFASKTANNVFMRFADFNNCDYVVLSGAASDLTNSAAGNAYGATFTSTTNKNYAAFLGTVS